MGLARNYNKHIKDDVSTIDFSADLTDEENLSPKHRRILYLLDRCFDCICDLGLEHAGTGALAKYCGTSSATTTSTTRTKLSSTAAQDACRRLRMTS